ncbi:MAG: hypothetical protein GY715_14740 [Planctomycetes bacterium]|nr:hypothetical protein [Planctomycetota bacterium]
MRIARRSSLVGSAILCGAGCSLEYHYPAPSASDLREFDALTVPGLAVDTGAMAPAPPSAPFVASLDHDHDRYFVAATVNGHAADLMLDWGSWVTVGLMPYMARTAKTKLSDTTMATSTFDGEGTMRTGVIDELEIAGTTFRDVPFALSNQDLEVTLGSVTVYRGKGMLGLTILAGYRRFAVDLANDRLHFGTIPAELLDDPRAVRLPVRLHEGLWIVADVDGVPLELKVDIGGYTGRVLLEGDAADGFMVAHPSQFAGHSTGFGDATRERRRGRAGVVRAGAYELRDVAVSLLPSGVDDTGGGSVDAGVRPGGVVGDAFFGPTVIGVDWDRRELLFVPVQ